MGIARFGADVAASDKDGPMPRALVNGIDLAWDRDGEGERLLFLHGSGSTMAQNSFLRRPFEDAFDVLTLDHRATGASQVPDGPFTMADCAADVLGLADLAGWDRFRLVGVSFGGMVAQEVAVTAPHRIDRLALLCTSAGGAGGSSYPLHEGPPPPHVVDTRFTPEWLAEHRRDRVLVDLAAKRMEGKGYDVIRGEALQLEARRHHDVFDRLPAVGCPTLVACGAYDGMAPVANGEAIASQVPDAEVRTYEGGHLFAVQDPAAVPDIIGWLAGSSV